MTQDEYLAILFDDNGFTSAQRRDFLGLRFGRRYVDELTASEKHALIEDLKARKVQPLPEDKEDEDAELTAKERFKRRHV